MNEKETRLKIIDPALMAAGWTILKDKHIIEKNFACIETPVTGMPITAENQTGNGFVDYVLFGDAGQPLALIEAKKSIIDEEQGRAQACLYASCLEQKYGIRPIIYYTNGYSIKIIDGIYPDRPVFGFHKKDELEYLIKKRTIFLKDKNPNPKIAGRYYQIEAINNVLQHLCTKHSRSLIVLATGTGKTRVSCALSEIFIRNNFVKRILFLADRKNLVRQAKEETFEKFLPNESMMVISEGKKEGNESKARIVFSTYQSMLSIIKDTTNCPYGIGHFDLIIIDEAHRSLFNKYAEIFTYFDSIMIGLTATPRNDIHKSTFKVFNLDDDMPNYEYDLIRGVKDGYLTYYRALNRTPDILKNGLTYSKLSPAEREEYEDKFTDEEGNIPEKIEGKEFYSVITNKGTIRTVLKDLMEEGLKVNGGDLLGKTIIFAKDHHHALLIQETFREMFPEKCNFNSTNGADYCVVIDNQIKYNEVLQREFKSKQTIRIVVSVDMMDTGVDIPEVVNLVFFKKVLSKIKFWQMVGRGTRLCENLNVMSPSKSYFERLTNDTNKKIYKNKQGFLIFDICNVFDFFNLNPDGKTDKSENALSLSQKIFIEKVKLIKSMQINFGTLVFEDKKLYSELKESLIQEIKSLNKNYIGVRANLKYIHRYSDQAYWNNLNQQSLIEIKQYVAPNIEGEIEDDMVRMFDYLCYKFANSKFSSNKEFKKAAESIYKIGAYLLNNKLHISEVNVHQASLNYISSDKLIQETTTSKINEIRIEIRELMKYLDPIQFDPIITDFRDNISTFKDAVEDPVDFSISVNDFKSLSEKVKNLINIDNKLELIIQIKNLIKPTKEAVLEFKNKVINVAKTADEYNQTFASDLDLIKFVRLNVELNPDKINEFEARQKLNGFNNNQIKYIHELIQYIQQNGCFCRKDLLKPELTFNGLFNSEEIKKLLFEIENVF